FLMLSENYLMLRAPGGRVSKHAQPRCSQFPDSLWWRSAPSRHNRGSVVEPEVFETEAVVDAVDHHGHPFHLRVPAGRLTGVKDDRPRAVFRQSPLDFPYQLLALVLVGF